MNSFKKWSGEERLKSLSLTNKAKKLGLITRPVKCRVCGQMQGILQHHNKDYDITLKYVPLLINGTATEEQKKLIYEALVPLCWRCHMIYHSKGFARAQYDKYFEEVKNGKMYPPVYKHDFSILERDHNIKPNK